LTDKRKVDDGLDIGSWIQEGKAPDYKLYVVDSFCKCMTGETDRYTCESCKVIDEETGEY